jgi:Domain of Unknown Function (DUF928)
MKCDHFGSIALGTTTLFVLQLMGSASLTDAWLQPGARSLSLIAPATAKSIYTPPSGLGQPKTTQGGGSRGCTQPTRAKFTLLVPADRIGSTLASHPTFGWYISGEMTTPMKFSLVEPGSSQPVWTQEITAQKPGFNQLTLPTEAPALTPGQRYRWTLAQVCPNKRLTDRTAARGWVQRIESQAAAPALPTAAADRAEALLRAGVWYDALAALFQVHAAKPQDQTTAKSLIALLDQGGLKQVADQERKRLNLN